MVFENVKEIDMDGFQVVSSDIFFRNGGNLCLPFCSLKPKSIRFSVRCYKMLNCCEHIRIEINPKTKSVLIVPVTESDKDAVHWISKGKNETTTKEMNCAELATNLYTTWKLDEKYNYRANGRLVTSNNNKVMILFEFANAEKYRWNTGKK